MLLNIDGNYHLTVPLNTLTANFEELDRTSCDVT